MQRVQVDAYTQAESKHQDFLEKMMEEQRREDAKERDKDREFFLNIGLQNNFQKMSDNKFYFLQLQRRVIHKCFKL